MYQVILLPILVCVSMYLLILSSIWLLQQFMDMTYHNCTYNYFLMYCEIIPVYFMKSYLSYENYNTKNVYIYLMKFVILLLHNYKL